MKKIFEVSETSKVLSFDNPLSRGYNPANDDDGDK